MYQLIRYILLNIKESGLVLKKNGQFNKKMLGLLKELTMFKMLCKVSCLIKRRAQISCEIVKLFQKTSKGSATKFEQPKSIETA